MNNFLSLCMIVKNEEHVLRRCLDSVNKLVDEIIIIDTGSTDSTKEIAFDFSSHVYDFEWTNDFAAARNESLLHATSKWVLVLDADEYMDREDLKKVRTILTREDSSIPQGFMIPVINFTGDESSPDIIQSNSIRIFSNHQAVKFTRPIHEQIQHLNGTLPCQKLENINIFHTGYLQETSQSKNKRERNIAIFKEMGKTHQFTEYDYFTLGNEYAALGDIDKAIYYYKRADTKKSQHMSFIFHCKFKIINNLFLLQRSSEAYSILEDCIARWPNIIDFIYLKARLFSSLGLLHEAAKIYDKCIQIAEEQSRKKLEFCTVSPEFSNKSFLELIDIHLLTNNNVQAVRLLTQLIESRNEKIKDLVQLLQLLLSTDSANTIITVLDRLYSKLDPVCNSRLFQASLLVGDRNLCEYYYSNHTELKLLLKPDQTLHFAIITNNKNLFLDGLNELEFDVNTNVIFLNILIGAAICLWQDPLLINYLDQNILNQSEIDTLKHLFTNINDLDDKDINLIFQILILLFNSRHYESYDWLLSRYNKQQQQPLLSNKLGDYFYKTHQLQLAFDYYSILLDNNNLQEQGYENIAQYYINTGNLADAEYIVKEALDLYPHRISFYTKLLAMQIGPTDRFQYVKQFKLYHTQYQNIPEIKKMLN